MEFYNNQKDRVQKRIDYLIQKITTEPQISREVVKKLTDTDFYELRIHTGEQYRVIMFTIDDENFQKAKDVLLLNGFHKKATKDYKPAIKIATNLLNKYTENIEEDESE